MKLIRFRVTNFRSVTDSGWVDVDDVTALIGVNESGKSNLLLALWKLKPVNEGDIQPTSDYPKTQFGDIREEPGDFSFVTAEFDTGRSRESLGQTAGISSDDAARVRVTRFFNGRYKVEFPCHCQSTTVGKASIVVILTDCADKIRSGKALKQEAQLKDSLLNDLRRIEEALPIDHNELDVSQLTSVRDLVTKLIPANAAKTSAIVPLVGQLVDELTEHLGRISALPPGERMAWRTLLFEGCHPSCTMRTTATLTQRSTYPMLWTTFNATTWEQRRWPRLEHCVCCSTS